ncbi:MAG TPA: arylsulfotransferase family protein [Vicinamibacterales bacterium]|nr:arylsulfotransferase family protein [Vicinamibacterales bacterium]HJO39417.1 arylsulfotransferase family protein [Vicinamibacterales bacterium]
MLRTRLALTATLLAVSFFVGYLVHRQQVQPYHFIENVYSRLLVSEFSRRFIASIDELPEGYWNAARPASGLTPEQQANMSRLRSVGYLGGVQESQAVRGVVRYDPELSYAGLNLYSSGHGPEAVLMDMNGQRLHVWKLPYEKAFPDRLPPPIPVTAGYWRKVHLYPNGDLLAVFEGMGLIRVDRNSELLWAVPNGSHHDLEVRENGEIYVLTSIAHLRTDVREDGPILEDFVTVLGADGVERRRYSVLDALRDSDFGTLLTHSKGWEGLQGDLLHTNALEILDGTQAERSPAFKQGNVLVSLPAVNAIAVIDLVENRVVWALTGMFEAQHSPTFVETGNLLIFDNVSEPEGSRVIEVDPFSQDIVWVYRGDEEMAFYSKFSGVTSRLPNGNTLITETEGGRAFEVTSDKRIVWEFRSPYQAGDNQRFIAALLEMQRLSASPVDFPFNHP